MTFATPWALALVPPLLVFVWLIAARGTRTVSRRQHRIAVVVRMVAVALLVIAVAAPAVRRPSHDQSVVFLVDRSASIAGEAILAQDEFLDAALEDAAAQADARIGVVAFGADVRVDSSLSSEVPSGSITSVVDDSATDLAGALRATGALLPTEGSRRVVVLTDGVATSGGARVAAEELAELGIAVDVVQLGSSRGPDVLVEGVDLPPAVREGDRVTAEIRIRSNVVGMAEVLIEDSTGEEQRMTVDVVIGDNTVLVEVAAPAPGPLEVRATAELAGDTQVENNTNRGLTRVLGPARVAVVEGKAGDADELLRALAAGGLAVERVGAIPDDRALLDYDAVVLVNIPAPADADVERLTSYVEDLGRGLVVVGGDQAYAMGGYEQSLLEELLPVRSNPDDLVRRQPVAEVLLIDTSGSMGQCHCGGEEFVEGGVNKTDISRAGAAQAINALEPTDRVGVLAFSTGTDWVLPLNLKPDDATARAALGELFPQGDTQISTGLRAAYDELKGVDDALRHIVLFTDGWDPNESGLLPLVREIADDGITVSVLGTGEGPGTTLQRMAAVGGGRYYPGTDLSSIPDIFVEETLTVQRNLTVEGQFFPILAAPSQVTADLVTSPALLGYVVTQPKNTASTPLLIGEEDPLLATWQRGLGRVTAWTSDATSRWSAEWVSWDGYVEFWGALVRDVLPPYLETPPELRLDEGHLEIRYVSDEIAIDAAAIARVRAPDGEIRVVPLQRTSTSTFEGSTRADQAGAYWVGVSIDSAQGTVAGGSAGMIAGYGDEFAFREPDPTLAFDIAAITGGRVNPMVPEVFEKAPDVGTAPIELWSWLAGLALGLFLIDVGLRRLVFSTGDLTVWKAAVRPASRRPPEKVIDEETGLLVDAPAPEEVATVGRLLDRKRR